jgi:hypothetical protein
MRVLLRETKLLTAPFALPTALFEAWMKGEPIFPERSILSTIFYCPD